MANAATLAVPPAPVFAPNANVTCVSQVNNIAYVAKISGLETRGGKLHYIVHFINYSKTTDEVIEVGKEGLRLFNKSVNQFNAIHCLLSKHKPKFKVMTEVVGVARDGKKRNAIISSIEMKDGVKCYRVSFDDWERGLDEFYPVGEEDRFDLRAGRIAEEEEHDF